MTNIIDLPLHNIEMQVWMWKYEVLEAEHYDVIKEAVTLN